MKVRVFYYIQEKLPSVKENMEVFGVNIKNEIAKLKKELETIKDTRERTKAERRIIRLEKFSNLQEGKPERKEGKEIQSILVGKTTENYLGSDLHMLRKRGVDIASLTLVSETNPSQPANSSEMKDKDVFIVNFGGNESLARKIGAGDILPPEVTEVKIEGISCKRMNKPRPGYYKIAEGKNPIYQPIYDGYKIEITGISTLGEKEKTAAIAALDKRGEKLRIADTISNGTKSLSSVPEDIQIAEKSENIRSSKIEFKNSEAITGSNHFVLSDSEFIKIGAEQGLSEMECKEVLSIMTLIFKGESGGNYNIAGPELAEGAGVGTSAIGRYQIMPINWKNWSINYFGDILPVTPENQDKIAFSQMCSYYLHRRSINSSPEYYVTSMGRDWYGWGKVSQTTNENFNKNAPTSEEYGARIYAQYQKNYSQSNIG